MTKTKAIEVIEANINITTCNDCCYQSPKGYSKKCEKCVVYQAIQTLKKEKVKFA